MTMRTLLSMIYRLFKPYWLTHVTCTWFKDTTLLFNVHLRFLVDFILCPTDKYMFKINNKKVTLICWMCSKLKINTVWYRSGVFAVDFDYSQHISAVFLLLTLNKYLSAGSERQVIMFWKHEKIYICFVIKIANPISFNGLSLHRIERNGNKLRSSDQCFSSKFGLGIPSVLSLFRSFI